MVYLIDAYALVYRGYFAFIRSPRVTSAGLDVSAVMGFHILLSDLVLKQRPDHAAVCWDPRGRTFRNDLFADYKATRDRQPEAIGLAIPYIERLLEGLGLRQVRQEGYEADDLLGTLAARFAAHEVAIVSPDKDCTQLVAPGVCQLRPHTGGATERLDEQGVRNKMGVRPDQVADLLALMGDTADNIPGCPGVGPKTATELLAKYDSIPNIYAHLGELREVLRRRLREHEAEVTLSRRLTEIRRDVPVPLTYDATAVRPPDWPALEALFAELEMRQGYSRLRNLLDVLPLGTTPATPQDTPTATTTAINDEQPQASTTTDDERPPEQTPLATLDAPPYPAPDAVPDTPQFTFDAKGDAKRGGALLPDLCILHSLVEPDRQHTPDAIVDELLHLALPKSKDDATAAARDACLADAAEKCGPRLTQRLDEAERSLFHDVEMPLVPVLASMEQAGALVDRDALSRYADELRRQLATLQDNAERLVGHPFNLASPMQIGTVLFDELGLDPKAAGSKRTKTGKWRTNEETLLNLAHLHPLVDVVLEHRSLNKLLGTYAEALPRLADQAGRIHTTFNQAAVVTGRLSSSNPNLQNIPVREEAGKRIRECFVAPPGSLLVSADYSQVELRVMAHYSRDPHMLAAFRDGLDVHRATAAKIYGVEPAQVTDEQRRRAKTANFGIIYGISAFGLAQRLGIARGEAQELIRDYFAGFPGVEAWIEATKSLARDEGCVRTLLGRRRLLPDINSRNATLRSFAERTAVNTPIQGTAADIMKLAMVRAHRLLAERCPEVRLILQVHDELIAEAPEEAAQTAGDVLREAMQGAYQLAVPLTVDVGVGRNWLLAH